MSANEKSTSGRLNIARELLEKFSQGGKIAIQVAESTSNSDLKTQPDKKLSNKQAKEKQRLRNKAIYYLSLREYSYQELKQKLRAGALKNYEAKTETAEQDFSFDAEKDLEVSLDWLYQAADEVVDDFKARSLLSDTRFTEQVVHARKAKFGSSRIAHELKQKGVDESLVSAAVANIKADEFTNAVDICRKKYKTMPQTREEWAKQARFLQSRGFGFDVIKKVLNQNIQDE